MYPTHRGTECRDRANAKTARHESDGTRKGLRVRARTARFKEAAGLAAQFTFHQVSVPYEGAAPLVNRARAMTYFSGAM